MQIHACTNVCVGNGTVSTELALVDVNPEYLEITFLEHSQDIKSFFRSEDRESVCQRYIDEYELQAFHSALANGFHIMKRHAIVPVRCFSDLRKVQKEFLFRKLNVLPRPSDTDLVPAKKGTSGTATADMSDIDPTAARDSYIEKFASM